MIRKILEITSIVLSLWFRDDFDKKSLQKDLALHYPSIKKADALFLMVKPLVLMTFKAQICAVSAPKWHKTLEIITLLLIQSLNSHSGPETFHHLQRTIVISILLCFFSLLLLNPLIKWNFYLTKKKTSRWAIIQDRNNPVVIRAHW